MLSLVVSITNQQAFKSNLCSSSDHGRATDINVLNSILKLNSSSWSNFIVKGVQVHHHHIKATCSATILAKHYCMEPTSNRKFTETIYYSYAITEKKKFYHNWPIPCSLRASIWCFWSLLARIPPCMLGCKVFTRPSSCNKVKITSVST